MKTLAGMKLQMVSSDIQLNLYTREPLKTIGVCYVTVEYEYEMHPAIPLYIIKGDSPENGCLRFKLYWLKILRVHKMCSEVGDTVWRQILEENEEIFDERPGKANNIAACIKIETGATPIFCKARPIPYTWHCSENKRFMETGVSQTWI